MRALVSHFVRDQAGATGIEYAVVASGVAFVIVTAVSALSDTTRALYDKLAVVLP